jgi:hypothetical protein
LNGPLGPVGDKNDDCLGYDGIRRKNESKDFQSRNDYDQRAEVRRALGPVGDNNWGDDDVRRSNEIREFQSGSRDYDLRAEVRRDDHYNGDAINSPPIIGSNNTYPGRISGPNSTDFNIESAPSEVYVEGGKDIRLMNIPGETFNCDEFSDDHDDRASTRLVDILCRSFGLYYLSVFTYIYVMNLIAIILNL